MKALNPDILSLENTHQRKKGLSFNQTTYKLIDILIVCLGVYLKVHCIEY